MKQTGCAARWCRRLTVGLTAVLMSGLPLVQAQGLSWDDGLRGDAPDRYTVVKGDTLWDISGRFLQHPGSGPRCGRSIRRSRTPT